MYKIAVIGTGYVGLTAAIGLADFGARVMGLDVDSHKIKCLKKNQLPIYESGMREILERNIQAGRLSFSEDIAEGIKWADVIFIGVGTPQDATGKADLKAVFSVAESIGKHLNRNKIVVTKSTVPIGTNEKIKSVIATSAKEKYDVEIVANPEFLREGKAMYDFLHPDRVVIGAENETTIEVMKKIYGPLYLNEVPFVITDLRTAEMIKYACNCFLATKVAFVNEMARLCDSLGANIQTVTQAMGKDGRIGSKFLHPGPGYGGSCFPKDTYALKALAEEVEVQLDIVKATIESNEKQKEYASIKVKEVFGNDLKNRKLAVLGLSFKAETDDMRDSASITIVDEMIRLGARVSLFDPKALENATKLWNSGESVYFATDEYDAAEGVDGILIITEWNQFRNLDLGRILGGMRGNKFFDFRNIYKRKEIEAYGAVYIGMGT